MSGQIGKLPVSTALREAGAGAESMAELYSRDPEGYTKQDISRIIEDLRAQRVRWAAAEAAGTTKGASRGDKPSAPKVSLASLGLGLGLTSNPAGENKS